jgi:putative ABC transport system permease protein
MTDINPPKLDRETEEGGQREENMPDWKQHIRPRLTGLRLSPTRENEIFDELAQHLDDRWRELVAGGASQEEATRLARALLRDDALVRNLAPLRQAQRVASVGAVHGAGGAASRR